MAISSSASLPATEAGGHKPKPFTEFRSLWRQFMARAFNPYRPELHYMRGPGPAWRAKYGTQAAFRLTSRED